MRGRLHSESPSRTENRPRELGYVKPALGYTACLQCVLQEQGGSRSPPLRAQLVTTAHQAQSTQRSTSAPQAPGATGQA